jgi:hypothetical protein
VNRVQAALVATGIVTAALALAALYFVLSPPKRHRYLIPEGYAGWLCVTFSVPGAPSLPTEDGFKVVRYPRSGVVETSDVGILGKMKDEFLYYADPGRRPLDVGLEMGGGYTVAPAETPERYTFKYWVSRNARKDFPSFVQNSPDECGPFPNYQRPGP